MRLGAALGDLRLVGVPLKSRLKQAYGSGLGHGRIGFRALDPGDETVAPEGFGQASSTRLGAAIDGLRPVGVP